ncbi:hypothetical protein IPR19_19780 [Xanthomonas perforans]|nr:hypothetical protein [Xanthomonas perforans]
MAAALLDLGLSPALLLVDNQITQLGERLQNYFAYRADILNHTVRPNLMDVEEADALFQQVSARVSLTCPHRPYQ